MFFLHRIWTWCCRFRHRCGYGVHSPSDFFLITAVIYEKGHYYAYRSLQEKKYPVYLPHYRKKVNRLLFRLVNYLRPESLVEVGTGNGASIEYMRAACRTMDAVTLKADNWATASQQLKKRLSGMHTLDCLHIGHTPFYKETFEQVLPYAGPRSCFIVGGIHETKEKRKWWEQVVASEATGVTFDLYDIGLVFFDKARYKQHYIVNFL